MSDHVQVLSNRGLSRTEILAALGGEARDRPLIQTGGAWLTPLTYDLSGTTEQKLAGGNVLHYLKAGSVPGGRIRVRGSHVQNLIIRPGMVLHLPTFDGLVATRGPGSVTAGQAELLVGDQGSYIQEPDVYGGAVFDPVDILGAAAAETYVSVTENVQPTGTAPTGSFNLQGARQIRIFTDGGAANTITSFEGVPWLQPTQVGDGDTRWYEQGEARFAIPNSETTAYRYREIILAIAPAHANDRMAIEWVQLLPAAATAVGSIIQMIA